MTFLKLFTTSGCHLCENAELLLAAVAGRKLLWQAVEIANSDELIEHYGLLIPVVQEPRSGAELPWPFDLAALENWLAASAP